MKENSNYKKLGPYIKQIDVRNKDLAVNNLLGLSIAKKFIPSIANTIGTDMSSYRVVEPGQFGYCPVTSRNGDKITVALYSGTEKAIVSQAYTVFEVIDKEKLLPEYLMLWFSREEFDRYARFNSWGSVREMFGWEDMCNVELPLPSIDTQRKIVAQYQTIEKRIQDNERTIALLEDTAQTIYRNMFVDGIDQNNLPVGWRKGCIEEFCKIFTGKKDVNQSLAIGKYRFFSCSPDYFYSNDFIAEGPSVLISGNGSYTGRVSFYNGKYDLYQRKYALTPLKGKEEYIYFIYAVLKFSFEKTVMGGTRGTSIPYIVYGDIADFQFFYEDLNMKSYSLKMNTILSHINSLEEENRLLDKFKNLILIKIG